jgi:hypothetical protein
MSGDDGVESANRSPLLFKRCPQFAVHFLDAAIDRKHGHHRQELLHRLSHSRGGILRNAEAELHCSDDANGRVVAFGGAEALDDDGSLSAKR